MTKTTKVSTVFPKWAIAAWKDWMAGMTTGATWHKYAPTETRTRFAAVLMKVCQQHGTTFYAARAEGAGGKSVSEQTLIRHGVVTAPMKKAQKRVKKAVKAEAVAAMTAAEEEVLGEL